jgi:hypothetical protein
MSNIFPASDEFARSSCRFRLRRAFLLCVVALPNPGGTGAFTATALEETDVGEREVETEWIKYIRVRLRAARIFQLCAYRAF